MIDQMRRIRVLHCPALVGGNPVGLARAERRIGLDSWVVAFRPHRFGYKPDEILWAEEDKPLTREAKRWHLLWRAIRDFDIVHFNFGKSIMPERIRENSAGGLGPLSLTKRVYALYTRAFELRDLAALKIARKCVLVTYQGDDARQGDFCLANFAVNHVSEVEPGYYSPQSDAAKRRRIARFAAYADRIYALNPDLLRVLPSRAQFLPYSHVDLEDWRPMSEKKKVSDVITIFHAPSYRGVKGTRFLLDAVSKLESEGVAIKLMTAEGVPQTEIRLACQRADLVVDQLLIGWYGGVAVEAMALGKPVVCYIRENDLQFIPTEMKTELPIINATPSTIYDVLREWLTHRKHELPELGRRSRAYVQKWHDPLKIAAKLKRVYETIMTSN